MSRKHGGREELITGLIFAGVFGFLYMSGRGSFWIFPCLFAGVIPVVRALVRGSQDRTRIGEHEDMSVRREVVDKEKQVLSIAHKEKGRVTPAIVALKTSLSIEEAEQILQDLARRGYASMEVTDDGRIEYRFSEFLPGSGPESPE